MQRAAAVLVGRHDFSSFESAGSPRKSSVRTIFDFFVERGRGERKDFVIIEIEADGFLYNMVRNIVGTVVDVGRGAQAVDWPRIVLEARDRRYAGQAAPPQGLFLLWASYGTDT